jgi:multidrug efflux system outer membrane protein
MPLPPGVERETDDYRAVLSASYEFDLWGRLYNASRAARAEVLASEASQETVRIALAADVVKNYFALRALDEQAAATQRSVETRTQALELQKIRLDSGVISEFEYRQLESEVLAARAQLPSLLRERSRQENAFAVLLGRSPKAMYEGTDIGQAENQDNLLDGVALVVPGGLPSELLLRRPDLVEAEQQLIAANARIGEARAAYFPSITLTGFVGSQAAKLDDLSSRDARTKQGAVSLLQPIFGIFAADELVDTANARQRQALAQYRRAIQNAFRDVLDAVSAQQRTREQFEAEDKRVSTLRETLRLAKLRYDNGAASQLDVLDAERSLLAAQLSRSEALRGQRAAITDLFKALGGGWRLNP